MILIYTFFPLAPCAFALSTNKTIPTYRCLLSELKDGATKIKLSLKPKIVMLDFEQAVINAFLYHFPGIEIKLCFFHFGQNVFRLQNWRVQQQAEQFLGFSS